MIKPPFWDHGNVEKPRWPKRLWTDAGIAFTSISKKLPIETFDALLGHPIFGASWEGLVLENVIEAFPGWRVGFYRTAAGAGADGRTVHFTKSVNYFYSVMKDAESGMNAILNHHQDRRDAGIPTVSVLLGSPNECRAVWRQWRRDAGRLWVEIDAFASIESIMDAWRHALFSTIDSMALAEQRLARVLNRSVHTARAMLQDIADGDRSRYLSRILFQSPAEVSARIRLESVNTIHYAANCLENDIDPAALCEDTQGYPAIYFSGIDDVGVIDRIARDHPSIPIAVHIGSERYDALRREWNAATSFLFSETVLSVEPTSTGVGCGRAGRKPGDHTAERIGGEPIQPASAAIRRLQDDIRQARSRCDPLPEPLARSLAERLLYEYLQGDPQTANRFRLNATIEVGGWHHGKMELDLSCADAKIAVEVDGYYHFLHAGRYRLDRRKDWLLQQRDWWVLRFLANDVIDRPESAVSRVREAVKLRRDRI